MNDDTEVISIALTRNGDLYRYRGPNTTDYPVCFEGVTTDDDHCVSGEKQRILSKLQTEYHVAAVDSAAGQRMAELIERLADADSRDEKVAVIENVRGRVSD